MITFFGDWHGDAAFAERALSDAQGELVHVGDFGLWDGRGMHFLNTVERALGNRVLRVVPGNHEKWDALWIGGVNPFDFESHDAEGFMMSGRWPHIRVCDRIAAWDCGGFTLAALAGANSIDRELRTRGVSWWPQESPTREHVDALVALLDGRSVDVLVTHDAPARALDGLRLYDVADTRWSPFALTYARESAEVVDSALRRIRPLRLVCGHHHVRRAIDLDGTAVTILNDNRGAVSDNMLTLVAGQWPGGRPKRPMVE